MCAKAIPVLLALGGITCATLPQETSSPSSGTARQRPPKVATPEQTIVKPLGYGAAELLGRVRIATLDKQLSIHWVYKDAAGVHQFHKEKFDLAYWPTAASRVSDDRLSAGGHLVVSGKRPSTGVTVIERWELGLSGFPDAATPTTVTKSTLFEGNAPDTKPVRMMNPVNSLKNQVFVQFEDTRDLYRMDAMTGDQVLVLTTAQEPSLAHDSYSSWWGGKLPDDRYVYVYQAVFAYAQDGATVLYDNDGDGSPDEWFEYAQTSWDTVEAIAKSFSEKYND